MGNNYKSKSYRVDAVRWNGNKDDVRNVCRFVRFYTNQSGEICCIDKKDGSIRAVIGDWLVKTGKVDSEESWAVMSNEEFEKVYEPAV